jgi:hypothetical protein
MNLDFGRDQELPLTNRRGGHGYRGEAFLSSLLSKNDAQIGIFLKGEKSRHHCHLRWL